MATSSPPATGTQARPLLPLLICLAVFCLTASFFRPYTSDDSFITYRYALNISHGLGPVYNSGEVVEGYSNPLWLGLLLVGLKLGFDLVTFSKILGLLCGLGALLCSYGLTLRLTDGRDSAAPWGLLLLATSAGLGYYALSGMETPLYAFLLTAAAYCLFLTSPAAMVSLLLAALAAAFTRPEGLGIILVVIFWRAVSLRDLSASTRRAFYLSTASALLITILALLLRHRTFGQWLPNTFYAKPPGAFGGMSYLAALTYLRDYLLTGGNALWLALAACPLLIRRWRVPALGALSLVVVEVALVVHARGDWMALSRFLVPCTPLLVGLGYAALLRNLSSRPLVALLLILLAGLNAIQLAEQVTAFRAGEYPQNVMAGEPQRLAGEWLRTNLPKDSVIATKRIGGVGYYSGLRLIDTLGLTDRRIAMIRHTSHTRGEAEQQAIAAEVFSRHPDAILLAVMKRWDKVPLDKPAPDVANNLRDVDNALYAGLEAHNYKFLRRLPQGGAGEFTIYLRVGALP
ncbi:MAG: hypothetical protein ABFD96_13860 [Armatimonadia bacterium]